MRVLLLQEVEDILYGSCILGTGGGGNLVDALALMRRVYAKGLHVTLASLNEIECDWMVASPSYIGSVVPPSTEVAQQLAELPIAGAEVATLSTWALQTYLGRRVQAVIASELGANVVNAMETAASLNIPLVDADPAGRAVPELQHSTFELAGVSVTPFALANKYGESLIIQDVANHVRADQIARHFAKLSGSLVGLCDHPVEGRYIREAVIAGTISLCGRIGLARRQANEGGFPPISKIILAGNGKCLLEGGVRESSCHDAGGFIEGSIVIDAGDPIVNRTLTIQFHNENMVVREGGDILSVIPELISILDCKTGDPIMNPECKPGMEVAVVVFPAPALWESDRGLELFGPKYIGLDKTTYRSGVMER